VALEDGVETVGEGVVRLMPEARVRHVGSAPEAEVTLVDAQRCAANDAGARHEEVPDGAEKVDEFFHFVQ
jgi:hypothetical protein